MKDFFISYTSRDRAWAEWIAWELEEAGYEVVIQAWDFLPGSNFVARMRLAAKDCRRTVAVLSKAYLESLYAEAEWNAAFAQDPSGVKRTLIPIRIESCELRGLDAPIVYLDLIGLAEEEARTGLLSGLSDRRAKPSTRPGFPGQTADEPNKAPPFPGTERILAKPREIHVGILSTEFLDLTAQKDLTYEANELVRELGALGATIHLLDPTHIALGVRDDKPQTGYADERAVNWEFFGALAILFVRRTRADDPGVAEMIYELLAFLHETRPNLLIFDPAGTFVRPVSKIPSLLIRARAGLAQADCVHIARDLADKAGTFLTYPLVVKPTHGWRGIEVEECKTPAELTAHLRKVSDGLTGASRFGVLLEDKLEILDEFRVVVVGGVAVGCVRKLPVPGRIARNRAVGSEWEAADDVDATALAIKTTEAHGYTFAGVDVARLKSGYVVIECNRNPQFAGFDRATGQSVARAMARHAMSRLREVTSTS